MSAAPATLRLFCALRLPDAICSEIDAWQRHALVGGRLTPQQNLHVTLCFLGETPAAQVAEVAAALRAAIEERERIAFELNGYRETQRVAMLTLADSEGRGGALAQRLIDGLAVRGLTVRPPRRWLPHITVMTFAESPRLMPLLPALKRFTPSDAAVYSSTLRRDGARYGVVEAMGLGG